MASSKYIQITPYLLLEYQYSNESFSDIEFKKMVNGYMNNDIQIFNGDISETDKTNNNTNNSVIQIGTNSFVTLDANFIIPFNDYSDQLTNTNDLDVNFSDIVEFDTIKYHIRAGYNLTNIDGIIIQVQLQDNNLTYVTLAQNILKKGLAGVNINPNPVTIGSNIYDKWIEIKIPSPLSMITDYLSATIKEDTLAAKISKSGNGFVLDSPIIFNFYEISNIIDFSGYERYDCVRLSGLSLEQQDLYENIGAYIGESDNGDYFEYYLTYNGESIESFIDFQNSIGNPYYIRNTIDIDGEYSFENIQMKSFGKHNYYRPIIEDINKSSFTLTYVAYLVNSKDQTSIIKTATYTSNEVSKWGKNLGKINISSNINKIYNKVFNNSNIIFNNPFNLAKDTEVKEIIKYNNVFINHNHVTATLNNFNFRKNNLFESIEPNEMLINTADRFSIVDKAVGLGKLTIHINPFDNYYKFTFVKKNMMGGTNTIDLSNSGDFSISFIDNTKSKIYISALNDSNIANANLGELAFRIDESISNQILQFKDKRFFITNSKNTSISSKRIHNDINEKNFSITDNKFVKKPTALERFNFIKTDTNPTSVLYWGYWMKTGDSPLTALPKVPVNTDNIIQNIPVGNQAPLYDPIKQTLNTSTNIIKGIKPKENTNNNIQDTGGSQITDREEVISQMASEIRDFYHRGLAIEVIYRYFLTPTGLGYMRYHPTREEFKIAATRIIPDSILNQILWM